MAQPYSSKIREDIFMYLERNGRTGFKVLFKAFPDTNTETIRYAITVLMREDRIASVKLRQHESEYYVPFKFKM